MPLYTYNGTLISGLTADPDCCCSAYNCYCYTRVTDYGATLVERKRVCFRAPYWDGSKFVFPDGQPCDPTKPSPDCTLNYIGIRVVLCSCPGGGMNPFRWEFIGSPTDWNNCSTIAPPP